MSSSDEKGEKKRGQLKQYPSDVKSLPKRQRLLAYTTAHSNSSYPNFLLNSDIASEIFSFLDVRSLYNMTMTSKAGTKILRHEHVVRSAMMQGGHSKTSMERLVPLIEKRCIWIPSPLRMLRLVNGRTCEHCCLRRVHLLSDNYGVFFCFQGCIPGTWIKTVAFNNKWTPYMMDQPRIAKEAFSSSAYVWDRPYVDASGERAGPLVSLVEMERIHQQGVGSVKDLLRQKDALDRYGNDTTVAEIIRVFKDTTNAAASRIRERKQMKEKAAANANDRRRKKLLAMIDTLHVELDDVPWKDAALSHQWRRSNTKDFLVFDCALTNELLREYNSAPSKATKKRLKGVTNSLRQSFATLEKRGFHDFSFLSDLDPVERAVKAHCLEQYPNYKVMASQRMDDAALQRIQGSSQSDLLKELLSLMSKNLADILAPVIVSSTVAIQSDDMREKATRQVRLFAANLLGDSDPFFGTRSDKKPPITPLQLYKSLMKEFPRLFQNTLDFLSASETIAWKEQHEREGFGQYRDPAAARERLEYLVNCVWCNVPMLCQDWLMMRDFKAVLMCLLQMESRL